MEYQILVFAFGFQEKRILCDMAYSVPRSAAFGIYADTISSACSMILWENAW